MDNDKISKEAKDVLLIPRITATEVIVPIDNVITRPGKSSDGLPAINDENHHGAREYCPRLLFYVPISIMSSWCPGTSLTRKNSNITMIEFVTSGKGVLIADGIKYQLQPNDVFFTHRGENNTLRALPPERFCKHSLTLNYNFMPDLIKKMGIRDISHIRLSKSKAERVLGEIQAIDKLICEKTEGFQSEISTKLFALLFFLAGEVYGEPRKYSIPEEMEACLKYGLDNIDKPMKLDDLARGAYTNVRNLGRIFMKAIGTSPHHWFEMLKMNLSAYDLANTNLKIREIADKYGYSDQFHFSHSFKRAYTMSPTKYRMLSRGKIKIK